MSDANPTPKSTSKPGPKIERVARLRWIALGQIVVNDYAQREHKQARVDHLVAHFDQEQLEPPVVNQRGSRYYVMDGRHRTLAAREVFGDTHMIQCWVYVDLTERQEAEYFLRKNDTLTVAAMDKYRIGVNAERETESDIDRIVRACGYVVSKQKAEGTIGAVGTLRRVYERGGARVLSRTLRMIDGSWGSAGMDAAVIDGIGLLCGRYNGELQDEHAVAKLHNMRGGVNGLMGKAALIKKQTLMPLNQCVAAAAVEVINSGKGGKKIAGWWKAEVA
ncbi:hypothetical protein F9L07_19500 [Pimelobacter simplex]|uniref:ParB/Sulfiredoxin domain-containing protein n=1 Tax=Nocardioides simplex TaxID=2045 RepID=A0A7J5DV66_NOCSI|nr:DUF6551 family protein [Pimelobacter simplex]KAB2809228.1 hypothetical protein F9L07_19500 [Pimelobacter simplex]